MVNVEKRNTEKRTITVLTPTYNRAYKLQQLYDSLCNQTDKDFQWLIIDDGSTDDTKKLVDSFYKENKIHLDYKYKENGGKHTALNFSHSFIEGEYLIIVDSDDCLIPEAIEIIKKKWDKYKINKNIVGITFQRGGILDHKRFDKQLFGEHVSNFVRETNLGMRGDHSETIKTENFISFDFPVFENERFVAEGAMWYKTTKNKNIVYCNEVIYLAEYLSDGLTKSGRILHIKNPKGCKWHASVFLDKCFRTKIRIKNALLYVSYSFFDNESLNELTRNCRSHKLLITFSLLPGFILYKYWKNKYC